MNGADNKAFRVTMGSRLCASEGKRSRMQGGFTLVETLMALVILVLMTGIVAMGVPVAMKTYTGAINGSNAQLLLSTTATELRSELGMAQLAVTEEVTKPDGTIEHQLKYYVSGDGYWANIEVRPGSEPKDVVRNLYMNNTDYSSDNTDYSSEIQGAVGIGSESLGAAKATQTLRGNLNVTFDSITLEDGVFTVKNLKVYDTDASNPLSSIDEYYIRALMLPEGA